MDLVKKIIRDKVIGDVILFKSIKFIIKVEIDIMKNKIWDKILKEMGDKLKREYVKIMK